MLDRLTARTHGIRIFVEPFLHGLDNLLVLPPRDATLPSRRALIFDCTGTARISPITVKCSDFAPDRCGFGSVTVMPA
jgi:hypothetical protein